jgi:hypothetical protein
MSANYVEVPQFATFSTLPLILHLAFPNILSSLFPNIHNQCSCLDVEGKGKVVPVLN